MSGRGLVMTENVVVAGHYILGSACRSPRQLKMDDSLGIFSAWGLRLEPMAAPPNCYGKPMFP